MSFVVNTLSPVLGLEITGLDLSEPLRDEDFERVLNLFHDNGMLVFRDQNLRPEQHIAFSRRFGELEDHLLKQYLHPEYAEILVLSNVAEDGKPKGVANGGHYWHTDISYKARPSLGSVLYALEVPTEGGDTLYANMYAAYDALSKEMKTRIAGLTARHAYLHRYEKMSAGGKRSPLTKEQIAEVPEVTHPVVRTHPANGRKALYVNPGFTVAIEGLPEEDSTALLQELLDHALRPEFTYAHRWRPHDLAIWDNRCTMHCATPFDPSQRRTMHRTGVIGEAPF